MFFAIITTQASARLPYRVFIRIGAERIVKTVFLFFYPSAIDHEPGNGSGFSVRVAWRIHKRLDSPERMRFPREKPVQFHGGALAGRNRIYDLSPA